MDIPEGRLDGSSSLFNTREYQRIEALDSLCCLKTQWNGYYPLILEREWIGFPLSVVKGTDFLRDGDGSPLSFWKRISEVLPSSLVKREQEKFSLHFWKSEWSWVWLVSISFCLFELIANRGGGIPFFLNHHQRHHHYRLARRTRITTTSTSLKAKGWLPPPSQHSPSGEKDYYYHLP